MGGKPGACLLKMKLQDKDTGLYCGKMGVSFSLLCVQCLGHGSLPRTISVIAIALWDFIMQGPQPQKQVIKESSLCCLHMATFFSKAAGECRGGVCTLALTGWWKNTRTTWRTGSSRAVREHGGRACWPVSARQQEVALTAYACWC